MSEMYQHHLIRIRWNSAFPYILHICFYLIEMQYYVPNYVYAEITRRDNQHTSGWILPIRKSIFTSEL